MTRNPKLLSLLLLTLLAGCAAAPAEPAREYLLPAAAQAPTNTAIPDVHINLAGYLDQSGIVLQSGPVAVQAARRHRWADPLVDQLAQALRYHLSQDGAPGGGRLTVDVVQFQGDGQGHARVVGNWHYHASDGSEKRGRFQESQPLDQDGYGALVKQLDAAWAAAAEQISKALNP